MWRVQNLPGAALAAGITRADAAKILAITSEMLAVAFIVILLDYLNILK